ALFFRQAVTIPVTSSRERQVFWPCVIAWTNGRETRRPAGTSHRARAGAVSGSMRISSQDAPARQAWLMQVQTARAVGYSSHDSGAKTQAKNGGFQNGP